MNIDAATGGIVNLSKTNRAYVPEQKKIQWFAGRVY
jgi:hypothetical protein